MFEIELNGAVVAQGRPKLTSRPYPHAYDPKKSRDFKNMLSYAAQSYLREHNAQPFQNGVELQIHVGVEVPKSWSRKKREQALSGEIKPTVKPDCDNIAKSIMDALTGVWYLDDKQICALLVRKRYSEFPKFKLTCSEAQE